MTSALYLEHYLDGLQNLPVELHRNFMLMRDLDNRAHTLIKKIDAMAVELQHRMPGMDPEAVKERIDTIQVSFNKAKEYGDDKVQLAIQTYELVDKHIRRLDTDLARFEAEIQDKAVESSRKVKSDAEDKKKAGASKGRKRASVAASALAKKKRLALLAAASHDTDTDSRGAHDNKGATPPKRGKNNRRKPNASSTAAADDDDDRVERGDSAVSVPGDVLDMPVDPNEPTYCLCHQVSYGEMIGCDNSECPIEWFHFACVGLTVKPKGKWYCPKCTQDRKKK